MNTKKALIITAAVASVTTGMVGASSVLAAQPPSGHVNFASNVVTALAEKFHLHQSDVQAVFDAQHQSMKTEREARFRAHVKAWLDQAVKNGKLTQAQEDLIIAKFAEVKNMRSGFVGKAPAEIQTAVKAERDALKSWAAANHIPESYLGFGLLKRNEWKGSWPSGRNGGGF